jgi:hypothetical protein
MNVYLSCYHKTGSHFLSDLKNLLEEVDKKNKYIHDCWSHEANKVCKDAKQTKIIHFIRHPYEIIYSGYLYHKTICTEPWCIDIHSKTEADGIQYNLQGLTYQQKLNLLNTEEGINMEMEGRSYNTIKDMYNATFDEYEFCLNVEMEDLILHFDKTVEKILNFIDNNNFVGLDYSSLHLENNAKNREHSTNKTDVIDRYQKYFTENNYTHFQKIFSEIKREKYKYIF